MKVIVPKLKYSFIFLFFLSAISLYAQQEHLSTRINIQVENQPLHAALSAISEKGGFRFSYNSEIIPVDSLVSFQYRNKKVKTILNGLFPTPPFQYKSIGNHLVLYKEEQSNIEEEIIISGYIVDARTGQKLNRATIYDVNKDVIASSDGSGYYEIALSGRKKAIGLNFCKSGYRDSIVYLKANTQKKANIELIPWQAQITDIDARDLQTPQVPDIHNRPLVRWVVNEDQINSANNLKLYENRTAQISFLPLMSSNGLLSGSVENNFSLNIISGYSRSLNGIEVGGFLNIIREDVFGSQVAGFGNIVGNNTEGIQAAGFFNFNGGTFKGVQLAGFSNLITGDISGVQAAGFLNTLNGKMNGVQAAGFANVTSENVDGVQASGFANVSFKDVELAQVSGFANYAQNINGIQAAGFGNLALGDVNTAQVAGFMNVAKSVKNLQIAGFMNAATYYSSGFQIAGFANYAKNINGMQIAGFGNLAFGDVSATQIAGFMNMAKSAKNIQAAGFMNTTTFTSSGFQIAGFINYAGILEGVQISVINISDSLSSGLPIGILSIVNTGVHVIELSIDETFLYNVAFKTGVPALYNIFKVGFNNDQLSLQYGMGSTVSLNNRFQFNCDITGGSVFQANNTNSPYMGAIFKITPTLNFKINKYLSIAAGPTANYGVTRINTNYTGDAISSYGFLDESNNTTRNQAWFGWNFALRIL